MSIKIYLFLLAALVFFALAILFIYYNQDITEEIKLSESIEYAKINISKETYRSSSISTIEMPSYDEKVNSFLSTYSSLDNRDFIYAMYKVIHEREPDEGGWTYWTGVLNRGGSRADVIYAAYQSPEYQDKHRNEFIQTTNNVGQEEFLVGAWTDVGTLTLENKGVFTYAYKFKKIRGCIDLKNASDASSPVINNRQFVVDYYRDSQRLPPDEVLEVKPNEEIILDLKGYYYPPRIPFEYFARQNIKGVSFYVLDLSEENPLSSPDFAIKYKSNDCKYLGENKKPLKETLFI